MDALFPFVLFLLLRGINYIYCDRENGFVVSDRCVRFFVLVKQTKI